jgi:hypothetical protein
MIEKMTMVQALQELRLREEFKVVLEFINTEKAQFVKDLRQAENPNDVMKLAGSIATLDELLEVLSIES